MSTVLTAEIEKFSKDADRWWDENGPFAPLHRLNPARMSYIRQQICAHYTLSQTNLKPFKTLKILDVGCGGGLVSEPMARLGASITGIDADPIAIPVAKKHAEQSNLKINYSNQEIKDLQSTFDVILALEIIEHVENPTDFVKSVAKALKPGGLAIFSTLNRTPKSYALGIVAAEYILRLVPRGTHEWQRFLKPSELASHIRKAGMEPADVSGLIYRPLSREFEISKNDVAVNYFMTATKKA
ncbi:MAG: bifunctional 2-polyprenyl-6-hydroxyphenol methylase/3-demethylubiquinol 3-O-methyltransferase UbiG [Alphaproteobacteria bacterium]